MIDRLLRPNLNLQNSSQGKKFATKSAVVEGRGTVGTFFQQRNLREKSFDDTPALSTKQYSAASFNTGTHVSSSAQVPGAIIPATVETSRARDDLRNAADANKTVAAHNFDGQREFREEGKSQKLLDHQNPPMTIEQVRELLNKNK